jgi:hypothetical protein
VNKKIKLKAAPHFDGTDLKSLGIRKRSVSMNVVNF